MRLCPLYSGSSGNCIYVGSNNTHLLIDVGTNYKWTEAALNKIGLTSADIDAVLITHEHSDHIQGVGVFSRKTKAPIYGTNGTILGIKSSEYLGKIDDSLFRTVRADEEFMIGDICVNAMHISHDANDPVAYRFLSGNTKMAVCTDLGCYTDYTVSCLQGMDAILLESNHDVKMLETNIKYPYYLKKRILGDKGHLSNENSGRLLSELLHDNIKKIFLGHLSEENNYPELAFEAVRCEINMSDNSYKASDFDITVAKRFDSFHKEDVNISECIEI